MSDPLRKQILVNCSVEHAFDVFTRRIDLWWPRGHRRFADSTLTLEPGVGGRFIERAPDGQENYMGEVTAWSPPDYICYTWIPGARAGRSEVAVRFAATDRGTRVDIEHGPGTMQGWDDTVHRFAAAWPKVLAALAAFIERIEREER